MIRKSLICLFGLMLFAGVSASAQSATPHPFDTRRCVNMGNALEADYEGEWGHTINPAHFARIRAAGFDTIRMPIKWSAHLGDDPARTIDPAFAARVDELIAAALAADLSIVLNVHHFEDLMIAPEAHVPVLLKIWEQVGARYRGLPQTVSFEIMNEPHTRMKGDVMRRAQSAAIDLLRQTNPTRTLILGGEDWSNVTTLGTNLATDDPGVIYTFHYYDPFDFTHQRAPWTGPNGPKKLRGWGSAEDRQSLADDMRQAKAVADILERPIFLGEFGAYEEAPEADRLRYTEAVRQAAEEAGIGWCAWNFTVTFSLFDTQRDTWVPGYLEALGLR